MSQCVVELDGDHDQDLNTTLTSTGAQLDRLGIVATRWASCGIVGIYVGSTLSGKINVYAASTAYR